MKKDSPRQMLLPSIQNCRKANQIENAEEVFLRNVTDLAHFFTFLSLGPVSQRWSPTLTMMYVVRHEWVGGHKRWQQFKNVINTCITRWEQQKGLYWNFDRTPGVETSIRRRCMAKKSRAGRTSLPKWCAGVVQLARQVCLVRAIPTFWFEIGGLILD